MHGGWVWATRSATTNAATIDTLRVATEHQASSSPAQSFNICHAEHKGEQWDSNNPKITQFTTIKMVLPYYEKFSYSDFIATLEHKLHSHIFVYPLPAAIAPIL